MLSSDSVLLIGRPNSGKTTCLREFARRHVPFSFLSLSLSLSLYRRSHTQCEFVRIQCEFVRTLCEFQRTLCEFVRILCEFVRTYRAGEVRVFAHMHI